MKKVNGFLPIALAVGDVRGYCVLSNHCHIQILDVSHDLLNGFVSGLPFSSPPPPSPISNLLSPSPSGRPDTQAKDRSKDHFSTIFRWFVAWPLVCNVCNLQTLHLTPDTPRQLSTSSEVEYQSLISFRRILSRLHLLRRLSPLLNNALHCKKVYIWPVLQRHNNVDAVRNAILSCAFSRGRSGGAWKYI